MGVCTDVYGIGAVLYRVLTGRPPISGRGQAALYNAAYRRPQRPRKLVPEMSRAVEAVLAVALAADSSDRFQTVSSLSTAFEQALAGHLPESILHKARTLAWNTSET